jgi:hypothetical protein
MFAAPELTAVDAYISLLERNGLSNFRMYAPLKEFNKWGVELQQSYLRTLEHILFPRGLAATPLVDTSDYQKS